MSRLGIVAIALSLLALTGAALVAPVAGTSPHGADVASPPSSPATVASPAHPSPSAAATTAAPSVAARTALAHSVESKLAAAGVPQKAIYLPNFQGGGVQTGNVVAPITRIAPAPMGLGDFGVRNTTGTPTPYVIDSTSWEGTMTLNSGDFFYIDNDGPDTFGVQLNAVLANVTVYGAQHNVYWIQDVMFYTPSNHSLQFIDNIWNLSSTNMAEPASTFYSYNGTPSASEYYYDLGPTFNVGFPFTVHLFVNSSITNISSKSYSTVRFGYEVVPSFGQRIQSGVYDTVLFNSNIAAGPAVPDPEFQVNGGHLTPTNFLLYDSELMIGGPGGGSTTQIYAINGSMQIAYLNHPAGQYVLDPTAWDVGTDTGETSEGVAESYTTAGTVDLGGGPSLILPLWNATPGGNVGRLTLTGSVTPDNAFVFLSTGSTFNITSAEWAPILPGGSYTFYLPPGSYSGVAMLADHTTRDLSYHGVAGGTSRVAISMPYNVAVGVDTPLFAWNNAQLANLSTSGAGTLGSPYILYNNQYAPFSPLFGEVNDFLFQVFPGVLVSQTTAYFDLYAPPPFTVVYPAALGAELGAAGVPNTNQLQIELYNTTHGTISDGSDIGGWIYYQQDGFPMPYYPDGEIVLWGATDTLVADNVFQDDGVGIALLQGSGNVIFGNEFLNAPLNPISYPFQFGIWEFESGDLIYNNAFDTTATAFSPSYNMYDGDTQTNRNSWNLSGWQPANTVRVENGFDLSGSITGAPAVCGNWWYDYTPGSALPYNEPLGGGAPYIATGGDYCPEGPSGAVGYTVSFSETGLSSGTWSVALAGVGQSASAGSSITFAMPNGTWHFTVGAETGLVVSPASGTVTVSGASQNVPLAFSASSGTPFVYLATVSVTGLPSGTAWSVTVGSAALHSNGSSVSLTEANGTYDYSVNPVSDYTTANPSGSFVVAGGPASAAVAFTADPGWLNATVAPGTATVTVDGQAAPLTSGAFSLQEMPGTYAIVVSATGYAPYYNNVSVLAAQGNSLSIHLTATTTSPGSGSGSTNSTAAATSGSGLSSDQFYGLIGALIIVALAIIIAALLLRRRNGGAATPAEEYEPPAAEAPPEEVVPEGMYRQPAPYDESQP